MNIEFDRFARTLQKDTESKVKSIVKEALTETKKEVIRNMKESGGWLGDTYYPSDPYTHPAIDTGLLISLLAISKPSNDNGLIYSTFSSNAPYSKELELGLGYAKPRPFMLPSLLYVEKILPKLIKDKFSV